MLSATQRAGKIQVLKGRKHGFRPFLSVVFEHYADASMRGQTEINMGTGDGEISMATTEASDTRDSSSAFVSIPKWVGIGLFLYASVFTLAYAKTSSYPLCSHSCWPWCLARSGVFSTGEGCRPASLP